MKHYHSPNVPLAVTRFLAGKGAAPFKGSLYRYVLHQSREETARERGFENYAALDRHRDEEFMKMIRGEK